MEKRLGTEMCIKFESEEILITGDLIAESVIRKRNIEKQVRSFALRVDEAIDCQHGEAKRSYHGFPTVVMGIIIIVLILVLFGRVGVFIIVFVLRVTAFDKA